MNIIQTGLMSEDQFMDLTEGLKYGCSPELHYNNLNVKTYIVYDSVSQIAIVCFAVILDEDDDDQNIHIYFDCATKDLGEDVLASVEDMLDVNFTELDAAIDGEVEDINSVVYSLSSFLRMGVDVEELVNRISASTDIEADKLMFAAYTRNGLRDADLGVLFESDISKCAVGGQPFDLSMFVDTGSAVKHIVSSIGG